jgi:hypothetical protein
LAVAITLLAAASTLNLANAADAGQSEFTASGWSSTGCKTLLESPADAKDAELRLLVAPDDGIVTTGSVTRSTGYPDFDKAILDAASHCQFKLSGDRLQPSWKKPKWVIFPWPIARPKTALQQKAVSLAPGQLEEGLEAAKHWEWLTALRLLLPFAEKGDARAQTTVANAYSLGDTNTNGVWMGNIGVHQDFAEAAKWFQKAADQGDAEAESHLAGMYWTGDGVPKDKAEGLRRYLKAANQGDVGAYMNLANFYQNGDGVPKDNVRAYYWSRLASDDATTRHFQRIREMADSRIDDLTAHMTPDQIAEAEQRALDWKHGKR